MSGDMTINMTINPPTNKDFLSVRWWSVSGVVDLLVDLSIINVFRSTRYKYCCSEQ